MANNSLLESYKGSDESFSDLAKEIVIACCEKYIKARKFVINYDKYLERRRGNEKATKTAQNQYIKAKRELAEATSFFLSDRCVLYTGGIDGKTIIRHLEERI